MDKRNSASYRITGCAYRVMSEMHYGLLKSAYEAALKWELEQEGFTVERQKNVPLFYKGIELESDYRIDLLVDKRIILDLQTTAVLLPEHRFQLFNYMRITHLPYGMLINFGPLGVRTERYKYIEGSNRVELITDNIIK